MFIHIIHLKGREFVFAFGVLLAWACGVEVSDDNNLCLWSKLKLFWEISVKLLCAQHQCKDGGSHLLLHIQTNLFISFAVLAITLMCAIDIVPFFLFEHLCMWNWGSKTAWFPHLTEVIKFALFCSSSNHISCYCQIVNGAQNTQTQAQ